MNIRFIKLSPTRNITVLVDSPVPRARHAEIAAKLLNPDCVGGEQAGFLEAPANPRARLRLQMMGGEFCGNASMALGACLARCDGLRDGECAEYLIEVSGSDALVPVSIVRAGEVWRGTVSMPLPEKTIDIDLDTDAGTRRAALVRMPGIAHLILPAEWGLSEAELRRRLPEWNGRIGADALGALQWNEAASFIDPLVYVPSAGTLVRERGCGSGTAAIGAWQAQRTGRDYLAAIRQAGGKIGVRAEGAAGRLQKLSISGAVSLISEGTAWID